jgi:hypothetical protein
MSQCSDRTALAIDSAPRHNLHFVDDVTLTDLSAMQTRRSQVQPMITNLNLQPFGGGAANDSTFKSR